jgi:DNA processing protein
VSPQEQADKQRSFWLALSKIKGLGPKHFDQLIKHFGSAKRAWLAQEGEWNLPGWSSAKTEWLFWRKKLNPNQLLEELLIRNPPIWPIIKLDSYYPVNLANIDNAPPVLYARGWLVEELIRGNFGPWQKFWSTPAIALVGTRQVTSYGRQMANRLGEDLAKNGLVIVSGMARGVDTLAHQSALAVGGKTVAVLGSGVDIIYPASNRQLYERIVNNGLVFSELPPATMPLPGYFPARNRIIAGLSLGVVVIEGGIKSGSLITASLAADQGREVFAVPGNVTSQLSSGTNHLIKNGAFPVTTATDILEVLNIQPQEEKSLVGNLNKDEKIIVGLLTKNTLVIDEIVQRTKMNVSQVNAVLTKLEIEGLVINLGFGQWGVK